MPAALKDYKSFEFLRRDLRVSPPAGAGGPLPAAVMSDHHIQPCRTCEEVQQHGHVSSIFKGTIVVGRRPWLGARGLGGRQPARRQHGRRQLAGRHACHCLQRRQQQQQLGQRARAQHAASGRQRRQRARQQQRQLARRLPAAPAAAHEQQLCRQHAGVAQPAWHGAAAAAAAPAAASTVRRLEDWGSTEDGCGKVHSSRRSEQATRICGHVHHSKATRAQQCLEKWQLVRLSWVAAWSSSG